MQGLIDLIDGKWYCCKAYLPTKDKEHRIIIIKKDKDIIRYFYITSQEKVKIILRNDKKALVELTKDMWEELTKTSYIQCDKTHLYQILVNDFKNKEAEGIKYIGIIPDTIQILICNAIENSLSYNPSEKASLLE